jgi:hypothetical protein
LTLSPGAGHGEEGDASSQGPAQEADQTRIETLPVSPKSANANKPTNTNKPTYADATAKCEPVVAADIVADLAADLVVDLPNAVIALEPRMPGTAAGRARAPASRSGDLVTVRAKPEKRKNAQQRAKERNERRNAERNMQPTTDKPDAAEGTVASAVTGGLATAHPKPEKRKNAKERAKEKYAKAKAADGITPDMTAKAKSKVGAKADWPKTKWSKTKWVKTKSAKTKSAKSKMAESKTAETKKVKKSKAA